MVNNVVIGVIYVDIGFSGDMLGIGVVVMYVNIGDDVYVRIYVVWNYCYIESNGGGRLLFVGWKLFWIKFKIMYIIVLMYVMVFLYWWYIYLF